jgi:hypothetical protein
VKELSAEAAKSSEEMSRYVPPDEDAEGIELRPYSLLPIRA